MRCRSRAAGCWPARRARFASALASPHSRAGSRLLAMAMTQRVVDIAGRHLLLAACAPRRRRSAAAARDPGIQLGQLRVGGRLACSSACCADDSSARPSCRRRSRPVRATSPNSSPDCRATDAKARWLPLCTSRTKMEMRSRPALCRVRAGQKQVSVHVLANAGQLLRRVLLG